MQSSSDFRSFHKELIQFFKANNLLDEDRLELLRYLKIGISGSYIIHNIIKMSNINIFNGISKYQVSRYLKKLKERLDTHNIKFCVVFDGIIFNKDTKYNFQESIERIREEWLRILRDKNDPEIPQFSKEVTQDVFTDTDLMKILEELKIEYIHAPYFASNQLRWFREYNYTHMTCCGIESLFLEMDFAIVDFDLENDKFYSLDIKKARKQIGVDGVKLLQLFFYYRYNPNIHRFIPCDISEYFASTQTGPFNFEKIKDEIVKGTTIKNLMNSDEENNKFNTLKRKMEISVFVINSDCEIEIKPDNLVDSLNDFYGPYFPHELYIFNAFNVIDKELMESIANANFVIKPPIADSAEYHYHIDNYFKTTLERILGIFTNKLHIFFKTNKYNLIRFYFPERTFNFSPREYKPSKFLIAQELIDRDQREYTHKKMGFLRVLQHYTDCLRELNEQAEQKRHSPIRKQSLDFELTSKLSPLGKGSHRKQSEDEINLQSRKVPDTNLVEEKKSSTETTTDQIQVSESPTTHQEILAYVYLSFLEMLEHVNTGINNQQNIMILGAALRKCHENFEESLIMLVELMKENLCLINGKEFTNSRPRKLSTEPILNTQTKNEHRDHELYQINLWKEGLSDEKKELIILISRVFCLINPSLYPTYPKNIYSEYDYDLSQYLVILKHLQKMLRFTFESILVNTYFTYCSKKDMKALLEFGINMPFRNTYSISLGIAIKKLLQSNESLQQFKDNNPHFVTLENDLRTGYVLWENVYFLLRYQENKGDHPTNLLSLFKRANDLLITRFKELKLLEGAQQFQYLKSRFT